MVDSLAGNSWGGCSDSGMDREPVRDSGDLAHHLCDASEAPNST
jgi:hypothetical protein